MNKHIIRKGACYNLILYGKLPKLIYANRCNNGQQIYANSSHEQPHFTVSANSNDFACTP